MIRRIFALASAAAITIYAGTVISLAARTGVSSRVLASGSDLDPSPSSATDLRGDDLIDATVNLDDISSVSIRAGQVVIQADEETAELAGSVLAEGLRASNDYGYYIDLEGSSLGSRLFVPADFYEDSFYIDGSGLLHGMRNSTFNCYIGNYTVRFPAYSSPQYRLTSGTGYTWNDVDLQYLDSPNVSVLGARENFWTDKMQTLFLVLIGGLCVCLYLKR